MKKASVKKQNEIKARKKRCQLEKNKASAKMAPADSSPESARRPCVTSHGCPEASAPRPAGEFLTQQFWASLQRPVGQVSPRAQPFKSLS